MTCRPKPPGVIIDNGAADRKTHPKTARFGRMKRGEDVIHGRRIKANSRVAHHHQHLPFIMGLRPDEELTIPAFHRGHRIDGVQQEVEYDLLQLHPIADDTWQVRRQFQSLHDPLPFHFTLGQHDDLADGFVLADSAFLKSARIRATISPARLPS
jgi:hypothetical protein